VRPLRIIFAGGGTGGHLFPAIAIAEEIKRIKPHAEVLFIGTKSKIEARVIPQKGWAFRKVWISGFHRSLRIGNILFPLKVVVSFMQSAAIIRKFRPDAVVGTGGYVSGPVLRAAVLLGVPTVIQEGNSYPGVTTRMLAAKADEVHLTFESSKKYFRRSDNLFVTGNPTRSGLENVKRVEALAYFNFSEAPDTKTVLVFGGSLGAHTINRAVEKYIGRLIASGVRLIWQTGREDLEKALEVCAGYPPARLWAGAFIDRMDYAYALSDLVVSRAGATTVAELSRIGKPALLVPYPHAAANHQVENARALAEAGAAEIVLDNEINEKFLERVMAALEENCLKEMGERSKVLGKPEASRSIAESVIRLAERKSPWRDA